MQIWDRKSQARDAERVSHNTNTALFYRNVCCPQREKNSWHTTHWVWWVTTWLSNSNLFIYPLDVFSTHFYQKHYFRICLKQRDLEWSWHTRWAALPDQDPQEFNAPAIKNCVQSLRQLQQMKRRNCKLFSRQKQAGFAAECNQTRPNFSSACSPPLQRKGVSVSGTDEDGLLCNTCGNSWRYQWLPLAVG